MIDFNWTFFLQLGVFLFLIIFLSKVLFKPVLKVLEAREQMHVGPKEEARKLKEEVEALKEDVYGAIAEAKDEAEKIRNESLSQARQSEAEVLAKSKEQAQDFLEKTRGDLAGQVDKVAKELKKEGEKMGAVLADKLISSGQGGAS